MAASTEWRGEDLAWLHRLARRLAGSDADADDLVQTTVLASGSSSPERRTWLGGVLRNRWRMWSRGSRRRTEREIASAVSHAPADPEQALARAELVDHLCAALGTLPELDRRIVILRHCEGLSSTRIGEELGLPAATVRTRLARALDRLRGELDRRWGQRWQLAVLGAPALPTKMGVGMVATLKVGLTGSAIVLAAAGTWMIASRERVEPTTAVAAATPTQTTEPRMSEHASDRESERKAVRDAWARKLAAIKASRRTRLGDDADDASATPSPAWSASELAEARKEVDAMLAVQSAEDAGLYGQLGAQVADAFLECLELADARSGKIDLQASLIGEPDVGTVVESVDVREDSAGDEKLLECVRESVYTFDFDAPASSLTSKFDFTLDLDERQISATNQITLTELPAALQRDPALLQRLPALLEGTPELGDNLRAMFREDPSLAEKYPDVAAKLATLE